MSNFTGKKISLTYDKVVQVPDQSTGILQDGLGSQVYTNSDSIGTIKMFYPMSGVLSDYFDSVTGQGVAGTPWENWHVCNGQDLTPDLRGRFIVGYDSRTVDPGNSIWDATYNTIGGSGGERMHTLQVNEMPTHKHYFEYSRDGLASLDGSNQRVETINNSGQPPASGSNAQTSEEGIGDPHENRPPYFTLLYVIKIN